MLNLMRLSALKTASPLMIRMPYVSLSSNEKNSRLTKEENQTLKEHQNDDSPKLKARKPLVKNFFVGVVDKELLGYPEVISRDETSEFKEAVTPIRDFFLSDRYFETTVAERIDKIQSLGLYGINVPQKYNGKGYNWTKSLFATEPEANDADVASGLLSHRVIVDLLNSFGTIEQKNKYLEKLGTGEFVATEAVYEDNVSDDGFLSTEAEFDSANKYWVVNGEKTCIVTKHLGTKSDFLFLVTAKTSSSQLNSSNGINLFLIESTQPGIKLCPQDTTSNASYSLTQNVILENVKVLDECRIGKLNESNLIAEFLFQSNRLRYSVLGLGLAKRILNTLSEYCIYEKNNGVSFKDIELPKIRLSSGFCNVYAMESMIYMTSGLIDEFDNPDVSLESAVTKYFTLTNVKNMASEPMDFIGNNWIKATKYGSLFDKSVELYTNTERVDSLRLYIGLSGLQHSGVIMHDVVNKSRNPLFNPRHIISKVFSQTNIDNPSTKMRLNENLHPTLAPASQLIEHSVLRLQTCTELLLTRHGNDIVEHHRELQRLADISTLIYAMFASVARASRSYCIGLAHADIEILTASTICNHGNNEIKNICNEILHGHYINNDNNLLRLGKRVGKCKGYFVESPLSYNF